MSLIEVLVTMIIFSVILGFVYGLLLSVQRQDQEVATRQESVGQARLALAQLDRHIRSGNVLYSPADEDPALSTDGTAGCVSVGAQGGTCMRVYTQANGDQRCVQWQVTGDGELRKRSWSPSWETDADPDAAVSAWSTIARGLQVGSTAPFALQGVLTPYKARLVDVSFEVRDGSSNSGTQLIRSSLSGRNTVYGFDPGICSPVPTA